MLSTRNSGKLLVDTYARDLADATADPDRYSSADKARLELPEYGPKEERFITRTVFIAKLRKKMSIDSSVVIKIIKNMGIMLDS